MENAKNKFVPPTEEDMKFNDLLTRLDHTTAKLNFLQGAVPSKEEKTESFSDRGWFGLYLVFENIEDDLISIYHGLYEWKDKNDARRGDEVPSE